LSKNNFSKISSLFALAVMAASVWLGSAHAAMAQAATFGELLCNVFQNAKPFGPVFQMVAYVSGIISVLRGIHLLRMHAEDPRNYKLNVPLMFLFGAACLLALPSYIYTIEHSLLTPSGGGLMSCSAGAAGVATGLDGVLTNFISNIKDPLLLIASFTAVLSGLFLIVRGLIKASKYGTDPKTHSMHSILTHIGFGAVLMTIGDNLKVMLNSVFGTATASSAISWTKISSLVGGTGVSPEFQAAINSALIFVQLIGAIAFVRGWLIMKKVVEGGSNASLTQGLTHIIGGVFAINIGGFLTLMDKTFGTNLL